MFSPFVERDEQLRCHGIGYAILLIYERLKEVCVPEKIRWGILGPGRIAHSLAQALNLLPGSELLAVGSRSIERAEAFSRKYGVPRSYGSYEELAADPDVTVIYVATPHPFHKEHSLLSLSNGKAVLCEKPLTINAKETEELIDFSKNRKLFLMEAMWTRFLPAIVKLRDWLSQKLIGEVRMLFADFGFQATLNPESRAFNPRLAGGALLDLGVYTIAFASMVFGDSPVKISGLSCLSQTGVDDNTGILLEYPSGGMAVLSCSLRAKTSREARIFGSKGSIVIPEFWHASSLLLQLEGKEISEEKIPFENTGFQFEAAEVEKCLREGKLESPTMPLDESLSILRIMDEVRRIAGLKYPME